MAGLSLAWSLSLVAAFSVLARLIGAKPWVPRALLVAGGHGL